ncbi:hypothetical protein BGZ83_005678 [Gryganskiella cystojenkinii]|nr:hypothetical protein BGZ83_005678 [Gryganskiella cystojenkinii]
MKYTLLLAACVALVQAAPLIAPSGSAKPIPDSYIVILKKGHSTDSFKTQFDALANRQNKGGRGVKSQIHREYKALQGFHASLAPAALKELQAMDEVAYVEQDAVMKILGQQNSPPSWGLTRVSEQDLDLSQPYLYNDKAGQGITAYVVDTGVYAAHSEFGGRAKLAANFITGSKNTDENGHGTHVSGTIGGSTYGVAKKVNIVGVKVLDAQGSGSTSGVVAGMDWVAQHATPGKSVVNMSLGGGKSQAIDDAAGRLFDANIPLIVAAGNDETMDACDGSPSGAPNTLTVAASDNTDGPAYFTSWGSCVEIFGPGVDITSSWIGSTRAKNTISGTSMATPHVVGVAALYLSEGGIGSAQALFDKLTSSASADRIQGELNGSPNLLVYNGGAN